MRERPKLSKSRYLAGLQCHLRLWYECYQRELAGDGEVDEAQQAIFDTGHEVGRLATRRHPGGALIDADHFHHEEALAHTANALGDRGVPAIFEAAFLHEDVRVRADVLARQKRGGWELIEVKSTLRVKDVHEDDLAVQHWVLRGAGLPVKRAGVLTLNRDYVYRGGEHDVDELFAFHDLTDVAQAKAEEVEANVAAMHRMLGRSKPPRVAPGEHCAAPYECPFHGHCTRGLEAPEHPLLELPNLSGKRKEGLLALGIESILDIPDDVDLSPLQQRVRRCVRTGRPYVSPGLAAALREPKYPIHHLDFETFMTAVPRYKGTRPYQALPFQWSDHVERSDGSVKHLEYLCREDKDPRREFAETLLEALGSKGTIVVYTGYELRVIRELAGALPKSRSALLALEGRVWDLAAVIREHYYHPGFHGSFSLKQVLPAVVPELGYDDLEIQDGSAAARVYLESILCRDGNRKEELHRQLLKYCGRDTLAMVELRRKLRG